MSKIDKNNSTNRTFIFSTTNNFDENVIKLDETMMKRITKYNKEKEPQKIQKEIEEKEKQIKKLFEKSARIYCKYL